MDLATQAVEKNAYQSIYDKTVSAPPGITLDNIQPHPKFLLCRVIPKDTMTQGGILFPEGSAPDKAYAVVLKVPEQYVGSGCWTAVDRPLDVEPGDMVFFRRAYGPDLELRDGTTVVFLRCWGQPNDDVIAVFKKRP